MKQIITIETSNGVNLEKLLDENKLSVQTLNEVSKKGWELLIEFLLEMAKMDESFSMKDDVYKVISVETLSDKLN